MDHISQVHKKIKREQPEKIGEVVIGENKIIEEKEEEIDNLSLHQSRKTSYQEEELF